jgi:hypothetical protein|tara:strand:+ start:5185 stop:5694 length:510 start_codon:yes stop_codon:yes gene_type:complete
MAVNIKTLDSTGGFSVGNTTLVNELKDVKNVNSLEVKNSFYSDSSTSHYIMRGINTSILSIDNVNTNVSIPNNTINFVETFIVGVNDNASGNICTKLDTVLQVSNTGVVTELSTMTTIVKDSVPSGQTWTINPFVSGAANTFSYSATRAGTTRTIKWVAYAKVVSIDWT